MCPRSANVLSRCIAKAESRSQHTSTFTLTLSEFLPDAQRIGQGVVVNQTGWETVLENNKKSFAAEFVQRSRFAAAYPTSLTPTQFVDALFTNGVAPLDADR